MKIPSIIFYFPKASFEQPLAVSIRVARFFWNKIPKRGKYTKLPQTICTKCQLNITKDRKMDQVSIKYTNILHCKTLQQFPKFGFLVWKQTIWQPWFPSQCFPRRRKLGWHKTLETLQRTKSCQVTAAPGLPDGIHSFKPKIQNWVNFLGLAIA
jgi:hypothetical protein